MANKIKLQFPYTLFFQVFVILQIFNAINCRKINIFKGFFNNPLFFIVLLFIFITQLIIVTFGGKCLHVQELNLRMHLFALLIGFGGVIFEKILRLISAKFIKSSNIQEELKDSNKKIL